MKKLIWSFMLVAAAAFSLQSCGKSDDNSGKRTSQEEQKQENKEEEKKDDPSTPTATWADEVITSNMSVIPQLFTLSLKSTT